MSVVFLQKLELMKGKQKGFAAIYIFIALVVVMMIIFFFTKTTSHSSSGKSRNMVSQINGPDCPQGSIFTKIPLDPDKILSVTPLGNLNPPDHTTPADHIYLVVKENNEVHPELSTAVFAPSDITISQITHQIIKKSGKVVNEDYTIDFSPCKDLNSRFGHVTKLSTKLNSIIEQSKSDCQTRSPRSDYEYSYCRYNLSTKVSAGEQIGEAGGGSATGLDFWTMDFKTPELIFSNPKRYNSSELHVACPINFFEKDKKEILSQKLGRYQKKRTIEPLCGQFNQEIPNTTAGNWMIGEGYIDMPESWSKTLSLVHDNTDPSIGVVSIGGSITSPTKIQFSPTSSGTMNRDFNQVKDDQIYCYQGQSVGLNSGQHGRVLIQLIEAFKLKVEYQNENCEQPLQFNSPTVYER